MKYRIWSLLVVIMALAAAFASAQTPSNETVQTPPPGNIELLTGYVHEPRRGKDSRVGVIYKKDGLAIGYDIGRMAAVYADQYFPEYFEKLRKQTHRNPDSIEWEIKSLQDKVKWRQRQNVNGDEVLIVLLKDSTLIASFVNSKANFQAKIDSDDKIADFLLMVLTYQPSIKKLD